MPPLTRDEARQLALRYLKTHPAANQVLPQTILESEGHPYHPRSERFVVDAFHELFLERIVMPGSGAMGTGMMSWPFYRITDYGEAVLSSPDYQPYDPTGYLAQLNRDLPTVDVVIVRYLEEALACLRANALLAAAVMIGCAAEKAALLLIEAFGNAMQDPNGKAKYEKETGSWLISSKYKALWSRLQPLVSKLPADLADNLEGILDQAFALIRYHRNQAGHPTGASVDRSVVSANLILFPTYCRRIYALIDYFQKNPV